MCYSTALRKQKDEIEERLRKHLNATFPIDGEYEPYYHQNGFANGNLQIIKMDDPKRIFPATWGLVPNWAKKDPVSFRKKSNTLNARAESIFEKSSFRNSARDKRCLILADGFFEPHQDQKVSTPYFCFQPSKEYPKGDLFLFAGLYNELDSDLYTTTILTVEANSFFAEIHNKKKRMPLVLDEDFYLDWLDDISEQSVNEIMATGFTNKAFLAYSVRRDLYKNDIDTNMPYIIEEVERNTLF